MDYLRFLFLFWELEIINCCSHCLSWNKIMLFDMSYVMYRISSKQITAVMTNGPPTLFLGNVSKIGYSLIWKYILRMRCNKHYIIFGYIVFEIIFGLSLMTFIITLWAIKSYAHHFEKCMGDNFFLL